MDVMTVACSNIHCMKSVQIRIYFWSVFSCIQTFSSPNAGKYKPEITPYLNTFHAVISIQKCLNLLKLKFKCKLPNYNCSTVALILNLFHTIDFFLNPLKISENVWFSVFRRYRKGKVTQNGSK